jgi:bifunctional enzyme Fae/Hps
MLDNRIRYLQIAFNYDGSFVRRILPSLPKSERILIEAGTPYIKREGMNGIHLMRSLWQGYIVADLKTSDGAVDEVKMASSAGANAATILGSSPTESLDLFVSACENAGVDAMIDMIGVNDPLKVMMEIKNPPAVTIIHRGRDEEGTRGKVIQYRHVNRIRSKFDVLISAAGGVDLKEARSAIFNGANIVVVNLVQPGDQWAGIRSDTNVGGLAQEFLTTIS